MNHPHFFLEVKYLNSSSNILFSLTLQISSVDFLSVNASGIERHRNIAQWALYCRHGRIFVGWCVVCGCVWTVNWSQGCHLLVLHVLTMCVYALNWFPLWSHTLTLSYIIQFSFLTCPSSVYIYTLCHYINKYSQWWL